MGASQTALQTEIDRQPAGPRVVVVGNGPVGVHFVNQLINKGWPGEIYLLGEEDTQPYNRVQLSAFLSQDIAFSQLDNPVQKHVGLVHKTRCRVVAIDRQARQVKDQYGTAIPYDYLVLATGSRPHVPSIPGLAMAGVYRFRDLRDVEALFARLARSRQTLIIGGGLLGLETARAMTRYSTSVSVVQHTPRLMNRQLDDEASARIQAFAQAQGIRFYLNRSVREVQGNSRVERVLLSDGTELACDTVVLATGIVPNTELAVQCGLPVKAGIQIDTGLQTSDPAIFAIGECADFESQVFGLVAPGLEQASVLASRLTGNEVRYGGSKLITRLKVLSLPVFSMGKVSDEYSHQITRSMTYDKAGCYRRLYLTNGRLVGALAVGEWPQISQVQTALESEARLYPWQLWRFHRHGNLFPASGATLARLPDSTVICNCQQVSLGQLRQCLQRTDATVASLRESLGVTAVCGSCKPLIQELTAQPVELLPVKKGLFGLAVLAILSACAYLLIPSPAPLSSVRQSSLEFLWSESLPRQITGFSILALLVLSLLVSLRKRLRFFSWLKFDSWRLFHALLTVGALLLLFAHTGISTGQGINRWLAIDFLVVVAIGAFSATVAALEGRWVSTRLKQAKRSLVVGHIITFWPLPVLLGFHVLSVYYF